MGQYLIGQYLKHLFLNIFKICSSFKICSLSWYFLILKRILLYFPQNLVTRRCFLVPTVFFPIYDFLRFFFCYPQIFFCTHSFFSNFSSKIWNLQCSVCLVLFRFALYCDIVTPFFYSHLFLPPLFLPTLFLQPLFFRPHFFLYPDLFLPHFCLPPLFSPPVFGLP